MKTLRFIAAAIPVIALAAGAAAAPGTTPKVEKCTQVQQGTRGYHMQKTYKCEVDLRQLKIIDDVGVKSPAPPGSYKIGNGKKAVNVAPGGVIL